jgi:hypothetical protein
MLVQTSETSLYCLWRRTEKGYSDYVARIGNRSGCLETSQVRAAVRIFRSDLYPFPRATTVARIRNTVLAARSSAAGGNLHGPAAASRASRRPLRSRHLLGSYRHRRHRPAAISAEQGRPRRIPARSQTPLPAGRPGPGCPRNRREPNRPAGPAGRGRPRGQENPERLSASQPCGACSQAFV